MTAWKQLVIFAAVLWLAMLAMLFVAQRKLMYLPDPKRMAPQAVGLAQARETELVASDGVRLVAWFVPPAQDKPVVLYFPGNGGNLAHRAARFEGLTRDGTGLLAVNYRGYGGSQGSPSESGLIEDALAAHQFLLRQNIAPIRVALMGESLGSGVAVALARQRPAGAIVLEAPFSSAADVAACVYWMFPVRWVMRDPFDSVSRLQGVQTPLLILHGDRDPVVPLRFGERLFAAASDPRRLVRIPGGGHQVIETPLAMAEIRQWIAQHTRP